MAKSATTYCTSKHQGRQVREPAALSTGRPPDVDEALRLTCAFTENGRRQLQSTCGRKRLPAPETAGAAFLAESIRQAVCERRLAHCGSPAYVVTISAGVASARTGRQPAPPALTGAADTALYAAKEAGATVFTLPTARLTYRQPSRGPRGGRPVARTG
ncbi:diguanylate cyclase domain-containing protein [Telluria mixta]|uniref:diguanylate cyclase domain-containing protein n=1 Tax=Telluria mixta TaxID=34071 RepID=UPI00353121C4